MPLRPCFSLICAEETFSFLLAWSLYGLWVLSPTVFSPQRHFPMMVVALKVLSFSLSATEIVGGSSGRNGDTGIGYHVEARRITAPGIRSAVGLLGGNVRRNRGGWWLKWPKSALGRSMRGQAHHRPRGSLSQRPLGGNVCRSCVLLTMKTSHHRSGDKSRWPR